MYVEYKLCISGTCKDINYCNHEDSEETNVFNEEKSDNCKWENVLSNYTNTNIQEVL